MHDFLTNNLVRFFHVLRAAGLRVSLSESIDAIMALDHIELLDRAAVKAALSACTAKSEAEKKIFSECFERFFIDPKTKNDYIACRTDAIERKIVEITEKASELKYQGQELEIDDGLKEVYSEISFEERKSILEFLERSSGGKNMKPEFKPLMETAIKSKLNDLKKKHHDNQKNAAQQGGAFHGQVSEAGIIADDVAESLMEEDSIIYKDLGAIEDKDMPKVIRIIRMMAERLRKNTRNRLRVSGRAGLDFKRTISASIASGGTLFKLKYKRKHGPKQKILTLCDVSASMYRFSGFVLKFISSLHAEISSADNFIFSTGIEKLNIRNFTTSTDIEHEITKSRVWKKGTDVNQAIHHILTDRFVVLNSSTVVIIVSDAKTIYAAKTAESLKQLASKVKQIYWLNPIDERGWNRIAGLDSLKKHCVMLDCSNLHKLNMACARF